MKGAEYRDLKKFTLMPSFEDIGGLYSKEPELADKIAYAVDTSLRSSLKKLG